MRFYYSIYYVFIMCVFIIKNNFFHFNCYIIPQKFHAA